VVGGTSIKSSLDRFRPNFSVALTWNNVSILSDFARDQFSAMF
jgi:hypothetical protein